MPPSHDMQSPMRLRPKPVANGACLGDENPAASIYVIRWPRPSYASSRSPNSAPLLRIRANAVPERDACFPPGIRVAGTVILNA